MDDGLFRPECGRRIDGCRSARRKPARERRNCHECQRRTRKRQRITRCNAIQERAKESRTRIRFATFAHATSKTSPAAAPPRRSASTPFRRMSGHDRYKPCAPLGSVVARTLPMRDRDGRAARLRLLHSLIAERALSI